MGRVVVIWPQCHGVLVLQPLLVEIAPVLGAMHAVQPPRRSCGVLIVF